MDIYSMQDIQEVVPLLAKGDIGILPFDTVLGLTGVATQDIAEKLWTAKKRESTKPFLLIVDSLVMLKQYVHVPDRYEPIVAKCSPGPITYIFRKKEHVDMFENVETLAIRLPDASFLTGIVETLGEPLFSTSANLSGEPLIHSPNDVPEELKRHLSFFVQGHRTGGSSGDSRGLSSDLSVPSYDTGGQTPSTIVDCSGDAPVIVRKGLGMEQLERVLVEHGDTNDHLDHV